jgi:hypothetical protein
VQPARQRVTRNKPLAVAEDRSEVRNGNAHDDGHREKNPGIDSRADEMIIISDAPVSARS